MKRLRITLSDTLKEAPSEIRIFRAGINKTTKGDFLFDAKASKAILKAFKEYGNRLCFDYAHAAVPEKGARPQDQKAAGWFDLEDRDGELWAVNIEWTTTAKTEIEAKEWMYISPWFIFDEKTGRVLEILNIALTNTPATKEAAPLIPADRDTAADRRTAFLAGFRATQRALEEALRKRYPQPNDWELWVAEVYDASVVFNEGGKLWQQEYSLSGLTAVLAGDRVQVEVSYVPVAQPAGVPADKNISIPQSHGAAAATERASAQPKESLMDKAFLTTLGLAENAPDTDALAKLTRVTAGVGELCKLTGNDPNDPNGIAAALGTASGWKANAEKLPEAQKQVADLQSAARKAEVSAVLDGAPSKVTVAMKASLLTARPFDKDEDVAWLKAHVDALPTIAALDKANKPGAPPVESSANTAAALSHNGKKYEDLSNMEKHTLYTTDKATFDALKADHAKRQGK